MSAVLDELKAQALKLSPSDRDELVSALIASLDGEPEGTPGEIAQAWDEEIARRIAQLDSGEVETVPFEEVMAELRAKLR